MAQGEPVDFFYEDKKTIFKSIQGRVEHKYYNQWGTICDHKVSDEHTAQVFCKSLNLPSENAKVIENFGGGQGPIWFEDIKCRGTE